MQNKNIRRIVTPLLTVVVIYVVFLLCGEMVQRSEWMRGYDFIVLDRVILVVPLLLATWLFTHGWLPSNTFSYRHIPVLLMGILLAFTGLMVYRYLGTEQAYVDVQVSLQLAAFIVLMVGLMLWVFRVFPQTQYVPLWTIPLWGFLILFVGVELLTRYYWCFLPLSFPVFVLGNLCSVGIFEEFVHRGVIQGYLHYQWGNRGVLGISYAAWVAAIFFVYFHNVSLDPALFPRFIYLLPLGLFYGVIREKTGTWVVPAIVHWVGSTYWWMV